MDNAAEIIKILKTDLVLFFYGYLLSMFILSFVISVITEAVKRTIQGVFLKKEMPRLIWFINIIIVLFVTVCFALSYYINKLDKLTIIYYMVFLSISNWGFNFLAYHFVVKWLFLCFDVIINIFKNFKLESEAKILNTQKEVIKNKELLIKLDEFITGIENGKTN